MTRIWVDALLRLLPVLAVSVVAFGIHWAWQRAPRLDLNPKAIAMPEPEPPPFVTVVEREPETPWIVTVRTHAP